jgi:sugar phosphate isomerase/epimerase
MHSRISIDEVCSGGAPQAEFIGHCRELGASRIVLSSPQLLAGSLQTVKSALAGSTIAVEALNHPFAIYPSLDSDCQKARDILLQLIDIGAELGTRSIYLITGGRGSLSWEQAAESFAEAIAPCTAAARSSGIGLMIENAPVLYADIHIAHSLVDTIALAELADVGVCIELFFCWAEGNLKELFKRALPRCGLVQVSDYVLGDRSLPGRAVPGDGVIPLEALLRTMLDVGYTGAIDIELIGPRIAAEGHRAATARAAAHIDSLLVKLGA